jgi:anti-sigma-K factor RskA
MNCSEIRSEYFTYALGIAEDPERAEIAEHLGRNCPACVGGVRRALETVAELSGVVTIADPPEHLRSRVVAMVSPERRRRWRPALFAPWVAAAALAMALITVLLTTPRTAGSLELEQALSILSDPSMQDASFGQPATRGRVFFSPRRGVVFIAAGLPPLAPHRTFELWILPKAGNPIPAGTFHSQANAAIYVRPGPAEQAAAVALTTEPEGGSPQPTTTPFIIAKL